MSAITRDLKGYEALNGSSIDRVAGTGVRLASDGSLRADEVFLFSGETCVKFSVCEDTDELAFELIAPSFDYANLESIDQLSWLVGGEFGWIWLCRNSMNYIDMIAISPIGIDPQVVFIGAASSIQFKKLVAI